IYIIGRTYKELGGSEYYRLMGFLGRSVPKVRPNQARRVFRAVTKTIDLGLIDACHDISEGGLAVAAAEMAFSGGYGIEIDLRRVPTDNLCRDDFILFSESNSRFLVEVPEECATDFERVMHGVVYSRIGRVVKEPRLCIYGLNGDVIVDASLSELVACWKSFLGGDI
ncbi:MAG: AIR synthase-related protein, partial [Candidatus Bathyarchaeia archaeon]